LTISRQTSLDAAVLCPIPMQGTDSTAVATENLCCLNFKREIDR